MEELGTTTPQKSSTKWGPMVSLDFVHIFLRVGHLQPRHPRAPRQQKSRWICQNRAGSREFHVEKTLKKYWCTRSKSRLHFAQKIIKNGLRSSELASVKEHRWVGGGPPFKIRTVQEIWPHLHEMTHITLVILLKHCYESVGFIALSTLW